MERTPNTHLLKSDSPTALPLEICLDRFDLLNLTSARDQGSLNWMILLIKVKLGLYKAVDLPQKKI